MIQEQKQRRKNIQNITEIIDEVDTAILDIDYLSELDIILPDEYEKCDEFMDFLESLKRRQIANAYYEGLLVFDEE